MKMRVHSELGQLDISLLERLIPWAEGLDPRDPPEIKLIDAIE
jgi:hypothetical protein